MRILGLKRLKIILSGVLAFVFALSLMNLYAQEQKQSSPANVSDDRDHSVTTSHGSRFRLGGISVGAGYSHFSGHHGYYGYPFYGYTYPYWGPMWGPGWYFPGWSSWGYPGYGYSQGSDYSGEIKIQTAEKTAEVYVDGALAGAVEDLKSFYLEPGVYNLEIRTSNDKVYQKRLYVLSGKTLKITPVFSNARKEE